MEIVNYKVKDFFKQDPETVSNYVKILSNAKPLNTKRSIWELKLKHVENLRLSKLKDDEIIVKSLSKMERVQVSHILNMRISEFFPLVNSLKEQFEKVLKAERALKSSHENVKYKAVNGGERMAKFGIYNTLIPLSIQLNITIEDVKNMKYGEVFTISLYNKERQDIDYEMNQIKNI